MGTQSFGRSTFVQVTTIAKEHYEETVRRLAAHIFESYSAPGMIDALAAARAEVDDMAKICEHRVGTLLAIKRMADDQSITERTRDITPPSEEFHARLWAIDDDDFDNVRSDTRPTELITVINQRKWPDTSRSTEAQHHGPIPVLEIFHALVVEFLRFIQHS